LESVRRSVSLFLRIGLSENLRSVIRKSGHRLSVRSRVKIELDGRVKPGHKLFGPML
jgi:hypothetical protein